MSRSARMRPVIAALVVLLLVAGCAATQRAAPNTASPDSSPPPGANFPAQPSGTPLVMGWDGVDNEVIMSAVVRNTFTKGGGLDDSTWIFSGAAWSRAPSAMKLPSLTGYMPMLVYDSDRNRELLVLAPNYMANPGSGQVWEWDGHSWQRRVTSHPLSLLATQSASAAYSPDLHATVLIDATGVAMNGSAQTWLYDGRDWRAISTPHSPLNAGYLSYDPVRHTIDGLSPDYVTWKFDGSDWSALPISGQSPKVLDAMGRQAPAVTFDAQRDSWVVFGGFDGSLSFNDTWIGDGMTWRRASPASLPPPRSGIPGRSFMVRDARNNRALLFGGQFGQRVDLADTWSWDGITWTHLAGPVFNPPPPPTESSAPPSSPASAPRITTPPPLIPPSSKLLFGVVEHSPNSEPDTVVIVGMDGYAKAKAKFTPRQTPYIGNAAVPLQGVAHVVGNSVFYIDGNGVVRKLAVGAQPQTVATFVQTPGQYETWFAVSPDWSQVIAGVLSYPAIGPVASPAPWPTLVGSWKFDLEVATAGGTPKVIVHQESTQHIDAQNAWRPIFPIGWNRLGPVVMYPLGVGTQNIWLGGPLYLLDPITFAKSNQFGGLGCYSASITADGWIPCTSDSYALTIRHPDGTVLWSSQVEDFNALSVTVSPNGDGVSDGIKVETRTGGLITIPQGFQVQGWLDDNTVVGVNLQGDLSWISLGDPSTVHDFGFKGDYVGTLS